MTITRRGQLTAETQFTGDFLTDGATAAVISSTKAKTGTYSYRHQTTANPTGMTITSTAQLRAGFWLNHAGISNNSNSELFRIYRAAGGSPHAVIWDQNDALIRIAIGGANVASASLASTNINRNDTWMHIGITFYAHASAGYLSVYVDGVQVLTYTGNTSGNVDSIYFGGQGWNISAYFDDFYVDDTTGESDAAPSAKRFLFSLVNAAGADAQFTPSAGSNYQNVDDSGAPDSDTTYNAALSAALKDTFNTADITMPADHVIRAAIIIAVVKRTDAGTASQIKLHSYDGATYQSGTAQTPTTSYNTIFERQPLQPDATAWNEVDFEAMQYGYESAGAF